MANDPAFFKMTTYPIHPGDRLQRRIVSVLTDDLLGLDAFDGFSVVDDREPAEVALPWLAVRVTESTNTPPNSFVWHVSVVVQILEDRAEADTTIGADTRPRHELRLENLSARIQGRWNTLTLADAINAIDDGRGVHVVKTYNQQVTTANEEETLSTEFSFTMICASTEQ